MIPESTLTLAVVGMPSILALCSASFLAILSLSSSVLSGILDLARKERSGIKFTFSFSRVDRADHFWYCFSHLSSFLLNFSSAFSFWAEVRLSASARLSTAMAKKTLRRISGCTELRKTKSLTLLHILIPLWQCIQVFNPVWNVEFM